MPKSSTTTVDVEAQYGGIVDVPTLLRKRGPGSGPDGWGCPDLGYDVFKARGDGNIEIIIGGKTIRDAIVSKRALEAIRGEL